MDFNDNRLEEASLWISRAKADLKMAKLAFDNSLFPESVYHSQQTSEKSLKSVLILFGQDIQKHKVISYFDDIVNLKFDFDFENVINNSFELERHWLSSKYPIKRTDGTLINPNNLYNKTKSKDLLKKSENVLISIIKFLKEEFDIEF